MTEVELNTAVMGVQDELFMKNIMNSLGLKVKLLTMASIDNIQALNVHNNWSVGGRTCHIVIKQNFWLELKEAGIVEF